MLSITKTQTWRGCDRDLGETAAIHLLLKCRVQSLYVCFQPAVLSPSVLHFLLNTVHSDDQYS